MAAVPVKLKKGSKYLQYDNSWGNKGSALVFDTKSLADAKRKDLDLKTSDVVYEPVAAKSAKSAKPASAAAKPRSKAKPAKA